MQLSASWRWGDLAHIVVADTRQYRTDQWDPIVGSELCGTSVTSGGDGSDAYENVTENPKRQLHASERSPGPAGLERPGVARKTVL